MGPVIRPFWDISIAENMEAFQASGNAHELPNILRNNFYNGSSGSVEPVRPWRWSFCSSSPNQNT